MQKHYIINGNKIAEEDLVYFKEKPSSGFSIEKNKATIARTIEKYKAFLAKKQKMYDEDLHERTDALASYFNYLNYGDKTPEKYFGKKMLAHLRGRRIMSTIFKTANGQKAAILSASDTPLPY